MRPPPGAWRAPALLAAAAVLAYGGTALGRLGFYHDDWWFLSVMRFAEPGLLSRAKALLADSQTLWLRPADAPLLAGLYQLFGHAPLGWQLVSLLANLAVAVLAERLMRAAGLPRRAAFLGAVLWLAFPNKDASLFWPMVVIAPASYALFLAATLAHLSWTAGGGRGRLALSAGLVAASLAFYDQSFFQFLAWPLLAPGEGEDGRRRARAGVAAAAAATAVFCLYKFVFVPKVLGVAFNKPLVLSPLNVFVVTLRAVESSFGWRMASAAAAGAFGALMFAPLTALAAAALPWGARAALGEGEAAPEAARRAALFGAALWVLGYLPFLVSDYRPTPFTHMNRVNMVPALGLAVAAAALASAGGRRAARERALALAASLALCSAVGFAAAWAEAWRVQEAARLVVQERAADWPPGTTLLLRLPALMVARRAPVMLASWDATGAVRVWTGDKTREADTLRPGARLGPDGVSISGRSLPYSAVRMLDMKSGAVVPLSWPPSGGD